MTRKFLLLSRLLMLPLLLPLYSQAFLILLSPQQLLLLQMFALECRIRDAGRGRSRRRHEVRGMHRRGRGAADRDTRNRHRCGGWTSERRAG